jgi:hypothetical protein
MCKFWQCGIDGPVGGADIDWLNGGICMMYRKGTMKLVIHRQMDCMDG